MRRKIIFKDSTGTELLLPVTPPSFEIPYGQRIETVNIHTLGDVIFAGTNTLGTLNFECLFPTSKRSYTNGAPAPPQQYIDTFRRWIDLQAVVRMIIPDTQVNIPVLIESMPYGERDGTNDIYATLTVREYRYLTVQTAAATQSRAQPVEEAPQTMQTYTIAKGDNLSSICRRFYGDSSKKVYTALASYNGIKNPNLIYSGTLLTIPPRAQL